MHNLPESCVQIGRIVFELAKKMLQFDKNTDFVTQLGEWISAVLEPFEMKFAENVEKLFLWFKFVSDLNYLLPFASYC